MNSWGGAEIESGKCACGMTNTCEGGQPRCNCDAGLWSFREDSGNTLPTHYLLHSYVLVILTVVASIVSTLWENYAVGVSSNLL